MGVVVAACLKAHVNLLVTVFAIAPVIYGALLLALRVVDHDDVLVLTRILRRSTVTPKATVVNH
jgi:hypothetical protein